MCTNELVEAAEDKTQPLLEWLCIGTVVCFAVLPDFYVAVLAWLEVDDATHSLVAQTTWLIVRAIEVAPPVLLIVYLTGADWQSIGIFRYRIFSDSSLGVVIWMITTYAYIVTTNAVPASWFPAVDASIASRGPRELLGFLLVIAASCANGFVEELAVRGYLLSRLEHILDSSWKAVAITTLLFASYHLYQGVGATIGIAVVGLFYGIAFCALRRLWPLVFAHALSDILAFLAA